VQLSATPQAPVTDLSWIEVGGTWTDGTPLSKAGFNFQLPPHVDGPFRYVLNLQSSGVQAQETKHGAKLWIGR
jgi:hypothetical protein